MPGEIPVSPIAREQVDAKDQHDIVNTLREFWKSAIALREAMDQGGSLTDMELLFIENHVQVIQMAYLRWKRKYRPVPPA
jgi:hypothetical protein